MGINIRTYARKFGKSAAVVMNKEQKRPRKISSLEQEFLFYLIAHSIPPAEQEYNFCPTRKWRFDFAWPGMMLAVELEGAIWTGGRHSRGPGILDDMEKYNWATVNGWRVLRYSRDNLRTFIEDFKQIRETIKGRPCLNQICNCSLKAG